MNIDSLFSGPMPGLEKAMDLTWRRSEALASNIANAETPKYRAVDLNFSHELATAFEQSDMAAGGDSLVRTNPKHLDIAGDSGAHLFNDLTSPTKPDGNNVDIDVQMGRVAQNSSKFMLAANIMRKKLQVLGQVIRTVG